MFLAVMALALALPVLAAQRGGSGRQGGGGQRPSAGQQRGQGPSTSSSGTTTRQRIRANDQQRDQLRTCTQTADRIRQQARDMDRLAGGKTFDAGKARQQRDHIREQLRTMEQENTRLMNGMSQEQQAALRTRIQQTERIRQNVNARLGELDERLRNSSPNAKQVRESARQIEREMNQWESQYRAMEKEMGVRP